MIHPTAMSVVLVEFKTYFGTKSDFNFIAWNLEITHPIAKIQIFSIGCKVEFSTQLTQNNKFITKIKSFHLSSKDHTT